MVASQVRDQPATFFVYWTMQAVWVWVTLLPVLLINNMAAPLALAWRASDIIGGLVQRDTAPNTIISYAHHQFY